MWVGMSAQRAGPTAPVELQRTTSRHIMRMMAAESGGGAAVDDPSSPSADAGPPSGAFREPTSSAQLTTDKWRVVRTMMGAGTEEFPQAVQLLKQAAAQNETGESDDDDTRGPTLLAESRTESNPDHVRWVPW